MWQDRERVASARFGLTTQNSFPSTSARVVHSKSSFLTSHRRVAPKPQRRRGGLRQSRSGASSSNPSTTRSSSSSISNPCSHTGRLNRLAESRGLRLPRRPVVLPLPPCLVALRRDPLRRNPSALVPRHRARHHPRAPQASLRRRRVRPRFPPHGPSVPRTPAPSREDGGDYRAQVARLGRQLEGYVSLIHHAATASYSWIRPQRTSIRRTPGSSAEIGHSGVPAGVRRSRPRWGRWAL